MEITIFNWAGPAAALNMPLSIKSHWPTDIGRAANMGLGRDRGRGRGMGIGTVSGDGESCHICAGIVAGVLQQFAKIASEFRPNVTTMTAAASAAATVEATAAATAT